MNLRDQFLKAGLVSKKQADAAERDVRKQQRIEEGNAERKGVIERREAARVAAEAEAAMAERVRRRRESETQARRDTVVLQARHILGAHRLRVRPGPQSFFHRSPDGREALRMRLPERIADDLRLGRLAIAYIDAREPEIVVIDAATADRVEALRPELILFRNRGPVDPDPAEQLSEA